MAGTLTVTEWRNRILEELGGEGTDDDLTERELDSALKAALECYNKYRPQLTWFPFEIPAAETTVINFFAATEQNDPQGNPFGYVANVLDVQFADANRRILGARAGFLEGYYLRWGYQGPRLFYELHVAERTYERLTGSRPDWRWDRESRKLYISSPSRDSKVMVLASRRRRIEEIEYDQEYDFRKLAVASAKQKLSRIRGAYGDAPGAGGPITSDWKELREEGKAEWKEVEDTLKVSLRSIPPPGWVG